MFKGGESYLMKSINSEPEVNVDEYTTKVKDDVFEILHDFLKILHSIIAIIFHLWGICFLHLAFSGGPIAIGAGSSTNFSDIS
jgi:hypothetical protein